MTVTFNYVNILHTIGFIFEFFSIYFRGESLTVGQQDTPWNQFRRKSDQWVGIGWNL
jgi:hypothetical protein